MALTPAEKQRRYRERLKQNPETKKYFSEMYAYGENDPYVLLK